MTEVGRLEPGSLDRLDRARTGVVESYNPDSGLGSVAAHDQRYPFHCTAIADGTRQIAVGTAVYFVAKLGALGRVEADDLVPR